MTRLLSLAVVFALVAAACGDDAGSDPTGPGPSSPPTTGGPTVTGALFEPTVARAEPSDAAPIESLAAGFNDLGFEILRGQSGESNVVLSPSSIAHALLMARAAADGPTGASIDAALRLPDGLTAHEAWNAIDQAIAAAAAAQEDVVVTFADRIWPRLDVEPSQEWIDLLAAQHGADVQPLDFAGNPSDSTQVINDWISTQTDGLIPELLPPGFIQPNTVLVLTDAVYFKARWETIFGKYGPVSDSFTRLDGSTVPVDFLQQLELPGPRGAGDGYVGAEIPYAGDEFSMLVIVPDEGRFEEVRDRLGQDLLDEVDASFTTGSYELRLPPWSNDTQIDLLPFLTDLGAAPGSYPAITEDAFLGAAVHGADIAVDEWGTVAAAATAFGFQDSGPPPPELEVFADQPFFYVIRHVDSGLVLFAGQVTDPTA